MIKNIIAIADIHIRPIKRHEEYKEQLNKFINKIAKIKPDRVVIAGDIFHSKITVSNEMSQIIAKFFNAITTHSKLIILPGNHDTIINSNRLDSISPIVDMLGKESIVYYKESGVYEDKWDSDIAWCVWSCLENQKAPDIKAHMDENPDKIKSYIGLYHGVINGSSTDIGFTFTDEGVDVTDFYYTDIFIAGDIHKHQIYDYKNYKGNGKGVMTSSLIQQDFGETLDKHGYVSLDYNNGNWDMKLNEIDNEYGFHTIKIKSIEELDSLLN